MDVFCSEIVSASALVTQQVFFSLFPLMMNCMCVP